MNKPKIENVSYEDIQCGNHMVVGSNSMLIQIVDPSNKFPIPAQKFSEIYGFKFFDVEKNIIGGDNLKITDTQAKEIANLLKKALKENQDIVVHCEAGIRRSGAVCEVGVMLGFEDQYAYRSPNLMVKHKLLEALGLGYDLNEPFSENGRYFYYDELKNKVYFDEKKNQNKL